MDALQKGDKKFGNEMLFLGVLEARHGIRNTFPLCLLRKFGTYSARIAHNIRRMLVQNLFHTSIGLK